MRKKELKTVITFETTTQAIGMEKQSEARSSPIWMTRKPLAANVYGLRIVFLQKSQLQTGKPESWAKSPFRLISRILMYWMLFDRR